MKRLQSGLAVFLLGALCGSASAEYPVALHFDEPNSNGDTVWLSESGWGVTLKMVMKSADMLGFAKHQNWANKGTWGFIVFEDPDGCPWMDDDDWRNNLPPAGCPLDGDFNVPDYVIEDETYLEFRPDVDESGVPDASGDEDEQLQLVYSAGSRGPEFGSADLPFRCIPGTLNPTTSGRVHAEDAGGTTLVDNDASFLSEPFGPGDIVRNTADNSWAQIVSVDSDTQITHTPLSGGDDNQWGYSVIVSGEVDVDDATGTTLIDNEAAFQANGVFPGRYVKNISDGSSAAVVSTDSEIQVTHTPLSGGADNDWDTGTPGDLYDIGTLDSYRIALDGSFCDRPGPDMGGETVDGWGIGSDDDLPGLFLYTDVGIGLVFDEPNFELTEPVGYRNLAGLLNSVTYDLSDLTKSNSKAPGQKGKPTVTFESETRVWGHLNMPAQVVRNIIQYDACTGNLIFDDPPYEDFIVGCDGENDLWRIDGGPIEIPPETFTRADAASIWQLENSVFTLKAFLVSGHAPDELFDANGDGDLADDAAAAGFTVISNTDSIDLIQLSNLLCWGGGGNAYYRDLDENGAATVPIVCPGGPGGIGEPPR